MDNRDIEDVKMQGRETAREILEEHKKELTEKDIQRAMGKMWRELPDKFKEMLAVDKPEIATEMEKLYGQRAWYGKSTSGPWPGKEKTQ